MRGKGNKPSAAEAARLKAYLASHGVTPSRASASIKTTRTREQNESVLNAWLKGLPHE